MSIRQHVRKTGARTLAAEGVNQGTADNQSGSAGMINDRPGDLVTTGETEAIISTRPAEAVPVNPEPLKQRIHKKGNYHQHPIIRLLSRLYHRSPWRPLSDDEKASVDEKRRRKAMEAVLRTEANLYRDRIINVLNRRDICYRYKKSEKDLLSSGIKSVHFDQIVMQPDAIYYRVDTQHLPRGVGILQLVDEDILTDLSLSCGRRISAQYNERVGCWFIVERATGVLGIPSHVKLTDMWASFPPSADGLSIPLGVSVNSRLIYRSFGSMYSMLVGGTIGSGKSNMLNVILCTLIRRNNPHRLKLLLVDLKGGLEFSFYEGIPHLLNPEITDDHDDPVAPGGIAYKREHVPYVLRWLEHEGDRRMGLLKEAGFKDIGRYNQHNHKHALPHIFLVIDEWADIKLDHKSGKESEELLTNIAQRFRALGIHVILCTQVPKSEILSTRIKGVLPAKLAYSCPTNQASMAIIDNGHAKSLEPAGRLIFQWQDEIQVQSPYINDALIHETVEGAKAGKFQQLSEATHDVTKLEILQYALERDNGYLSRDRLFNAFQARGISKQELMDWLMEWEEEKEIIIGSSLYQVKPAAGPYPRRLVSIDNQEDDNDPATDPLPTQS